MEEGIDLIEGLKQILPKVRKEYINLSNLDLGKISEGELRFFFRHSARLKQLISSIESFLEENQM